jgi:hypothetical protein
VIYFLSRLNFILSRHTPFCTFAFRLSSFPAFRLSGFPAFRISGFLPFRLSGFSRLSALYRMLQTT